MNPVNLLIEEHNIIKEAIDISKNSRKLLTDSVKYENTIRELLFFFRNYADNYHHHKEEQILFPEMVKANEMLEQGIVFEMFENHNDFRDLISTIENSLNNKDFAKSQNILEKYCEALLDHIAVEDEEVFEIAKSLFDDNELEKIYFRFLDIDSHIGIGDKDELKNKLNEIRKAMG